MISKAVYLFFIYAEAKMYIVVKNHQSSVF